MFSIKLQEDQAPHKLPPVLHLVLDVVLQPTRGGAALRLVRDAHVQQAEPAAHRGRTVPPPRVLLEHQVPQLRAGDHQNLALQVRR